MLYGIACLLGVALLVYSICNGILKITGWTDPQERKAATIAAMTAAILSSDKTPKTK